MLFRYLFEILRGRWLLVVVPVVGCLLGGVYVLAVSPPRYQATARVSLDYIKSDPDLQLSKKMGEAYVNTQMQMIRDYQVAIPAAEALGLLEDIDIQTAFAAETGATPDDFPRWVARRIMPGIVVKPFEDSNILEISYVTSTPESAIHYAEALRAAYIRATVEARRQGSAAAADVLARRAEENAKNLLALQTALREIENEAGVLPAVEARRLTDMVAKRQGGSYVAMPSRSRLPGRLAEAEATLAEAERVLGPNNPNLARLRAARDAAKLQVEAERGAIASSTNIDSMIERSRQSAIEAQKDRVLSQRQLALEVRLLQDEIEARSVIVKAMNAQVAQLRVLATSQDVNLTPIGAATPKSGPVFPKPELILGGTGSIGLAIGVLLAILTELLNRRLRFAYQLDASAGAMLIGVTPSMHRRVRPRWSWRGRRLGNAIAAQ